jgi:hypothetical protein
MRSDPRFVAWQNGAREDPADIDPGLRPWLALISETTRRGVAVRRARIVSEPVSEYIRFEHHVTAPNVVAGEDVRWLPRRHVSDLALPGGHRPRAAAADRAWGPGVVVPPLLPGLSQSGRCVMTVCVKGPYSRSFPLEDVTGAYCEEHG